MFVVPTLSVTLAGCARSGGKRLAGELGVEFLGEIPLDTRIRFGGDSGVPIVVSAPDSEHASRFLDI